MTNNNKWQVFILHFAGGNAYSFQFLKPHLQNHADVHALELPGRGKRLSEPLLKQKKEAVADYVRQIMHLRTTSLPYVIYGHSMGATLALEVTAALEKAGDAPLGLVVSGNAGPGTGAVKHRYLMDQQAFKQELLLLGGISEEILEHQELFAFFEPIMRADFEILEADENWTGEIPVLKTPITAVMGSREETVGAIENWKRYTSGDFRSSILPGNHFFIYEHPILVAKLIHHCYDRTLVYGY